MEKRGAGTGCSGASHRMRMSGSGAGLLGLLLLLLAPVLGRLVLLPGLGLGTGGLLLVLHGVITSFPAGRGGAEPPGLSLRSEDSMAWPAPVYTYFFRKRGFLLLTAPSFSKYYTISLGTVV